MLETFKKGLFNLQNSPNTETPLKTSIAPAVTTPIATTIAYRPLGVRQAGTVGGTKEGLLPCLQNVYRTVREKIAGDQELQEKRTAEMQASIYVLEADNKTLAGKIKNEDDNLKREEQKIEELKGEIADIQNHPETITDDPTTKLGFIIGLVIIVFLTVYLFIFYSSASYSAFFKQFTLNSGIAESIFDPQALQVAWQNGVTELTLILTIPFVFLGLGYLIYKFGEEKGVSKYFKITALVIVTFIFDSILAYEIVEKIYNIQKMGTFQSMPDMTVSMAAQQVNFWLIIFSGFMVYIIWGFVFSFIMSEYAKLDKVNVALEGKNKKMAERRQVCKDIKIQKAGLAKKHNDNDAEINKLNFKLQQPVIYVEDMTPHINEFFSGWLDFMVSANKTQQEITECEVIKDKFLEDIRNTNKANQ